MIRIELEVTTSVIIKLVEQFVNLLPACIGDTLAPFLRENVPGSLAKSNPRTLKHSFQSLDLSVSPKVNI